MKVKTSMIILFRTALFVIVVAGFLWLAYYGMLHLAHLMLDDDTPVFAIVIWGAAVLYLTRHNGPIGR